MKNIASALQKNHAWHVTAIFYGLLVYFALFQLWGLDFSSYYSAAHEIGMGLSPYHHHLWDARAWALVYMPANPNPPLTLFLFSFFAYFNYPLAFTSWLIFSFALGLIGVYKTVRLVAPSLIKGVVLLYLLAFPVVMNTGMGQLGGVLLFILTVGYEAYLKRQDSWAGFWWGLLIALKLFPGLLLIYVFLQKRYITFVTMFGWFLVLSGLPALKIGFAPYLDYLHSMNDVNWYGINWNASLFGFLFRLFAQVRVISWYHGLPDKFFIDLSPMVSSIYYFIVGMSLLTWIIFFNRIEKGPAHKGFVLVLVLMLLLSPMGWIYYFPMLLLPLLCTFYTNRSLGGGPQDRNPGFPAFHPGYEEKNIITWFIMLFFLYFPMPITHSAFMTGWIEKISIYSIHFYGLLMLTYLILTIRNKPHFEAALPNYVKFIFKLITIFSLSFVVLRMVALMGMATN